MAQNVLLFLTVIFCLTVYFILVLVLINEDKSKRKAGIIFLPVAAFNTFQFISLFTNSLIMESIFQSISHIFMIVAIVEGTKYLISFDDNIYNKTVILISRIVAACDIIMFIINPFKEILVGYSYNAESLARWDYIYHPLYNVHRILVHAVIGYLILCIIIKAKNISKYYMRGYMLMGLCAGTLALFNIILQFIAPNYKACISIITFSFFLITLYIILFGYIDGPMLDHVRFLGFNEYNNPVMMFDYSGKLILKNGECGRIYERRFRDKDRKEIDSYLQYKKYKVDDFKKDFDVSDEELTEDNIINIRFIDDKTIVSYRVTCTNMMDSDSHRIGLLLMFNDTTEEMDSLTGFHKEDAFYKYFNESYGDFKYPASILMLDIKGLASFNDTFGKAKGDDLILLVAMNMMKYCPEGSYFLRGKEANLYAVCQNTNEEVVKKIISEIKKAINKDDGEDALISVRATYGLVKSEVQSITQVAENITVSMKTKKMVDIDSQQNSILYSLIQMQKEADPLLERHIKRTRNLCNLMAEKLSLSDYQKNNLVLLSVIHDIGNIGVPLDIVNKPGRLTKGEWEIMKSHVDKGYRIAEASEEFRDVAVCILHHHECYDGSGYPDGLKGDSIPYLSRIIAVIEAYDAMTNERPYRPPMSSYEARREIVNCKGKQYDPTIVDVFIDLLDEIAPIDQEQEKKIKNNSGNAFIPMSVRSQNESQGHIDKVRHSTYILNDIDEIIEIDDAFEKITGYTKEDVIDLKMSQRSLIFDSDWEHYMEQVSELIEATGEAYIEHRIRCKDGSEKYVFCYGRRYFDNVAKAGRSTIMLTDISESKKSYYSFSTAESMADKKEAMELPSVEYSKESIKVAVQNEKSNIEFKESESDIDELTGLMGSKLYARLNERLFANTEEGLLVCRVDIDNFAKFSIENGRNAATELIRYLGSCINQVVNNSGITTRYEIDGFSSTISIGEETDKGVIRARVSEVWGTIMDYIDEKYEGVTISLGASFAKADKETERLYDDALKKADDALAKAKEKGKACYEIIF